jgi:F-type H+-transporting ATPase subunit delta
MSVSRIATRYAKSLISLAKDQGKLEAVKKDIDALSAALQHRELLQLFKSPVVKGDKKRAIVDQLFGSRLDELTMAYLQLLIRKSREGYFPEIAAEFANQYREEKHITPVRIVSAVPLSDRFVQELRGKILATGLTHENLDIETAVDPAVLGGFVVEFGDKRYDATVREKLKDLTTLFSKNLYIREF